MNVVALARSGGTWRGTLDIAAFERLGDVLFDVPDSRPTDRPSVSANLDFALDDEGRPRVTGICKVVAPICCSRCAETVDVEVESRVDFRVVATEAEVERLMPTHDAVVSEDGCLRLTTLVEDDILLSIPANGCVDGARCNHAREAELAGRGADLSPVKPLGGLRALVEGSGPF